MRSRYSGSRLGLGHADFKVQKEFLLPHVTAPLKTVQVNGVAGQSEWALCHLDGVLELWS